MGSLCTTYAKWVGGTFEWQSAYFTDGSVIEEESTRAVGAAAYCHADGANGTPHMTYSSDKLVSGPALVQPDRGELLMLPVSPHQTPYCIWTFTMPRTGVSRHFPEW